MDSMRQHLEEERSKDYEELKQLEDKLRYEGDPRFRGKWESAIRDTKQRISDRWKELNSLISRDKADNDDSNKSPNSNGLEPMKCKKVTQVGAEKWLTTKTTLYKNGLLIVETYSCCKNLFHGLRGRVFLVAYDATGTAIFETNYKCNTCGGVLDFLTYSEITNIWKEQINEEVAQVTQSIDIVHSDGGSGESIVRGTATWTNIYSSQKRQNYLQHQLHKFSKLK